MSRVLARYGSGAPLIEISKEMYVSYRQMKQLSMQIQQRLSAGNLAQACLIAHVLGYITLPDENGVVSAQSPFAESA